MPHFSYPVDSICGTPISGVVGSTIVYEGEPGVIGFGVMDAGIVETCQVQSVGQVVGETISRTSDVMLSVNGAVPTAVAAGSTIEIDNTSVIRQLRQIEERINAGIKVLEGNATTSSVGASDGTE